MSKRLLLFLAVFCSLQVAWQYCRGSEFEYLVIDVATVRTAAWLTRILSPQQVIATGNSLHSSAASMNVLNGCEGLDLLFLLTAAFVAAPLRWRARCLYIATGSLLVFVLNQLRLVMLWQLLLHRRDWFGVCHELLFPLILVLLGYFYFAACLVRQEKNP